MKKGLIVIIAIVAVIAIVGGVCVSNYNALVTARETVDSAEANIDTYLQRRADLIPNIVASVKSFAKHETEVYSKIADARQKLVNAGTVAEKAEANSQLTSALQGLNVVVENYPELKTELLLQEKTTTTQSRIITIRLLNSLQTSSQVFSVLRRQNILRQTMVRRALQTLMLF